eukprot:jgi/Astpho2/8237/fgenesh1_pg.00122_%23_16_t
MPAQSCRALFHCNYCARDISATVRIKCAECPDFDLCLDCFAVGVEITPHKSGHAYRVVDNLSFPLYHPDWGADEELLLLEAIDMSGLGNWAAVAEHVGTKSKEVCKEHYLQIYVGSPHFPQPRPVPEMAGMDHLQMQRERQQRARVEQERQGLLASPTASTLTAVGADTAEATADSRSPAGGTAPQDTMEGAQTMQLDSQPAASAPGAAVARPGSPPGKAPRKTPSRPAKVQSWRPDLDLVLGTLWGLQGVKETTHPEVSSKAPAGPLDNGLPHEAAGALRIHTMAEASAATPLAPTAADATTAASGRGKLVQGKQSKDPEVKAASELQQLTGFHIKRAEFDPEYDNEAELLVAEMEFKEDDSKEEMEEKMKLMDIYNARLTERERRRDFCIQRGLTNIKQQQLLDRRRTPAERLLVARLRALAQYQGKEEQERLEEGLLAEHRLRARIQELCHVRRAGVRTLAEAEVHHEGERRRLGAPLETGLSLGSGAFAQAATLAGTPSLGSRDLLRTSGSFSRATAAAGGPAARPAEHRSTAPALAAWRARRGVALDISALPGVELLIGRERELCASARLLPAHYLELKALMLRDAQRRGCLPRAEAKGFFRLDAARAVKVYDLLASCGWLQSAPQPEAS